MDTVTFAELAKTWRAESISAARRSGADLSEVGPALIRRDMQSIEVDFAGFDVSDTEGGKAAVLSWLRSKYTIKIARGAPSSLRVVVSKG